MYIVINIFVLRSICLSSSLVHFEDGPDILQDGLPRCWFDPLDESSTAGLGFEKLSHSSEVVFFLLLKRPNAFQIWQLSSFRYFSYEQGIYFSAKFHSYILTVYFYCLYQDFQLCFIFCQNLNSSYTYGDLSFIVIL